MDAAAISPNGTERFDMDRMGILTLSALVAAVLLAGALFIGPTDAADGGGTDPTDISDKLTKPEISMSEANTEAEVEKWIKDTWLASVEWNQIEVGGTALAEDYYKNLDIAKEDFKAAVAGTPDNKNGTEGLYKFKITDSTGKITATVECRITAVFDYKSVPCSVPMEDANTEDKVISWLNTEWIGELKKASGETGSLSVVKTKDTSFVAAVAGTSGDRAGKNGSLTFDLVKTDGSDTTTVAGGLRCTVTAYAYGQIESADRTVIFEGGKVSGLTISSADHVLTLEELQRIVADLGGKDASLVPSLSKADKSVYRNPLVIGEGEDAKTYRNGDVIRIDGRICVLLIGDDEFATYEIGTSHWVKYDRETFDESFREDDGKYICKTSDTLINIEGVAYYLGYLLEDPSTSVISEKNYIGFIYDMSGRSAGYVTFDGSDIDSSAKIAFMFNDGMDPSSIEGGRAVAGTYTDKDGKDSLIYILASKDVSLLRNGKAYTCNDGTIIMPLGGVVDKNNVYMYSIGTDAVTRGDVKEDAGKYSASCPSNLPSPLVVVENSLWNVEIPTGDFRFPDEPSGSDESNTTMYIAAAVVVLLLIGGGFYYFRYMKP